MLNITRRRGERIVVGDDIFVSVIDVSGQTVRLGIEAPRAVRVYREEIWLEIKAQNEAAAEAGASVTLPTGVLPSLSGPGRPGGPAGDQAGEGADGRPASQPVNRITPRS